MAKRRVKVGSVLKAKDGSTYIKIYKDHTLKDGQTLSVESKKKQLDSLQSALEKNIISEENAEKARERIEKIPEYVISEITYYAEKTQE